MKTRTPSNTAIASRRARSGNRRDLGFVLGGVAAALASVPVVAQPVNARVTAGSARIDSNGNRTVITTSDRAIIEADSFNVGRNDVVIFRQPGSNSRVLNRITGATPTEIFGTIRANGNVFFTNPAGIYFGNGAVLDVGGLYAAAGSISDADFLNGNFNFTNLTGSVINEGAIFAQNGIHLIGAHVANFGSLVTESGVVTLAAGDDVLIGERNGRLFARIEGGNLSADGSRNLGVENAGTIQADRAVLGVGDHFALALYDTSVIYADAVDVIGGENSFATVSGTIDASNANGVGGSIDIATDRIALEGATLDASGSLGGGTIRVGADRGGASIDGRDAATRVAVDADSTLSANATVDGDGGEIVVYAKDATAFWGLLEARGAGTGEGGFAEVSAKGQLTLNGGVDLSGPAGDGTLLLDPDFIEIVADGTATAEPAAPGAVAFADAGESGGLTQFEESTLEQLLDNQAIGTLVLQANSDITFESGVTIDTFNVFDGDNITASLTLEAGRSIIMNTDVVIDLPTGDVTLIANSQNPDVAGRAGGLGSILMFDNASITTQAGSIALDLQGTGNTATDGAIIIANLTARGMNAGEGVVLVQNTGEGSGIFNSTDSDNSGGHSVIADQRVILASLSDGTQTGSFDFGAVGSLLIPTLFDGPITIDAPSITLASTNQIPEFNLVQSDITIESAAAGLAVGGTTVAQDLQGIEFRAGVNQQQFMGMDVFSDALVINLAGELTLADGASIIGTATNNTGGALDIIDITATALNLGDGSSISVTQIGAPGDTLDIDINAPVVMNGGSSISTDNGSVSITGGVTDGAMGAAGDLAVSGSEGVTIDGGDITLTNNANANGLDLDSANGAITVANVDSDGAVTMDGGLAVSAMDVTGVSVGMSGDSVSAGNVTATDGAVTLDGTSFVTALDVASQDAGGDMTPGGITVTSTGQVMLGETVNDADGLSTANGGISVAGMDIDVAGTVMAVNSGASLVAGSNGGGSVDVVDAMGDGAAITAEGPVLVAAGDGSVLVGDVNATDGSVTMTATTTIMAGDVTSSGIAGGITVVASDQVTLGETANNADGLSSVMGDILVSGSDVDIAGTVVATGGGISLQATSNGGGSVDVLDAAMMGASVLADTSVNIDASNGSSTTGDITGNNGSVDVLASDSVSAGNVLGTTVSLAGTAGSVDAGNVTAMDGAIDIDAGTTVTALDLSSMDAGFDGTPGGVAVDAGDQVTLGETMDDASGIFTTNGAIEVRGTDIDIAGSVVGLLPDSSVVLDATSAGGSVDVTDGMGGVETVVAGTVTIDALDGMGTGGSINAGPIVATNGGVDLDADTTITADRVEASDDAADGLTAGDVTIDAMQGVVIGMMSGDGVAAENGSITINAMDIDVGGAVEASNGSATLNASLNGGGSVDVGGNVTADGPIDIDAAMGSSTTGDVLANGGSVDVLASDSVTAGAVSGTSVALEGTAGSVTAGDTTATNGDLSVTGDTGVTLGAVQTDINGSTATIQSANGMVVVDSFDFASETNTITGMGVTLTNGGTLRGQADMGMGEEIVNLSVDGSGMGVLLNGNIDSTGPSSVTVADDLGIGAGSDVTITVVDSASMANNAGDITLDTVTLLADPGNNPTGNLTLNSDDGVINVTNATVANGLGAVGDPAGTGNLTINANTDGMPVMGQTTTVNIGDVGAGGATLGTVGITADQVNLSGTEYAGVDVAVNATDIALTNMAAPTFGDAMLTNSLALNSQTLSSAAMAGDIIFQTMMGGTIATPVAMGSAMNPLNAGVQFLGGTTTLGASIDTTGDITVGGPAILSQDAVLNGDNISLAAVDSAMGTPFNLTLNAMTGSSVTGPVGANSPLQSFTNNSALNLGGDVTTIGGFTQNGDTIVTGDSVITTTGTTGASDIAFNGTIDGMAGNEDLTLITSRVGGGVVGGVPDNDFAKVSIQGDVGATTTLGDFAVNFDPGNGIDGRAEVPVTATIIFGDQAVFAGGATPPGIEINVDSFSVGGRETVVGLSALTIDAASSVRIGDVAAPGALVVTAPTVQLLGREAGLTFDPIEGEFLTSNGTDIVSGTSIDFSTITSFVSFGGAAQSSVEFATPGGSPNVNSLIGNFLFKSFEGPLQPQLIFVDGSPFVFLDPRSDGITSTSTATTIANLVQLEDDIQLPDIGLQISTVQARLLRLIGINPRDLTPSAPPEAADFNEFAGDQATPVESLADAELYIDMFAPGTEKSQTIARLDAGVVQQVTDAIGELFAPLELDENGNTIIDPETGEELRREAKAEIAAELDRMANAYFDDLDRRGVELEADFDGSDFVRFIEASEDGQQAVAYLRDIRQLLDLTQLLGLAQGEIFEVRSRIALNVQSDLLSAAEIREILNSEALVTISVRR